MGIGHQWGFSMGLVLWGFLTEVLTGTSSPSQSKQEDFSFSPLPELKAVLGDRKLQHRKTLDRDVSFGTFLWLLTTCLQTLKQCLGATGITGPCWLLGRWSETGQGRPVGSVCVLRWDKD